MNVLEDVVQCVEKAIPAEELVFITGKPGSGKSQVLRDLSKKKSYPIVDCKSFAISVAGVHENAREDKIVDTVLESLEAYNTDYVLLDRLQVFLQEGLGINPLEVLKKISKKQKLVVAWTGFYDNEMLYFNKPWDMKDIGFDAKGLKVFAVE